jgi:hypothetical protein
MTTTSGAKKKRTEEEWGESGWHVAVTSTHKCNTVVRYRTRNTP